MFLCCFNFLTAILGTEKMTITSPFNSPVCNFNIQCKSPSKTDSHREWGYSGLGTMGPQHLLTLNYIHCILSESEQDENEEDKQLMMFINNWSLL